MCSRTYLFFLQTLDFLHPFAIGLFLVNFRGFLCVMKPDIFPSSTDFYGGFYYNDLEFLYTHNQPSCVYRF